MPTTTSRPIIIVITVSHTIIDADDCTQCNADNESETIIIIINVSHTIIDADDDVETNHHHHHRQPHHY